MGKDFTMPYFWETVESLKAAKIKGVGFKHFDDTHMMWICITLAVCIAAVALYKSLGTRGRRNMRITVAMLCVADEIYKVIALVSLGAYTAKYLPLHLCSINIIIIAIHAFKQTKTMDNFLYAFCIPSAILALVIPSWNELPLANFMHLHSFTVHILLLLLYPLMLTFGDDIVPNAKHLPKTILLLLGFAVVAYIVNENTTGANFMFLKSASDIAPLVFFKKLCGTHLVGFPVLAAAILTLMYAPVHLWRRFRKRKVA